MTPEEKLRSRSWRLLNSAGLLWSILSFGILTGVGFLIRGIKSKNQRWIRLGIGFLIVGIGLFATAGIFDPGTEENPNTSLGYDIWGWVLFATFIGGITTAIVTNKQWLLWKAHSDGRNWYEKAGASPVQNNSFSTYGYDPNAAATAFETPTASPAHLQYPPYQPQAQHTVSTASPAENIDVNSASAQDLVARLGIDSETANRIVSTRSSVGSFTSFEQLMTKAKVQPHLLIPHRNNLTFEPVQTISAPSPHQPEPKANHNVRKLDI